MREMGSQIRSAAIGSRINAMSRFERPDDLPWCKPLLPIKGIEALDFLLRGSYFAFSGLQRTLDGCIQRSLSRRSRCRPNWAAAGTLIQIRRLIAITGRGHPLKEIGLDIRSHPHSSQQEDEGKQASEKMSHDQYPLNVCL